MQFKLVTTKNGQHCVEISAEGKLYYIHSRYNPEREADRWVSNLEVSNDVSKIIVVGMGGGHHIRSLIQKYPEAKIEIWDFNTLFYSWIRSTGEIEDVLCNKNINYFSSEDLKAIQKELLEKIGQSPLIIYKPSLFIIDNKLNYLREKLEDIEYIQSSYINQKHMLVHNFENNQALRDPGINELLNTYNNKPFILVSAGPSLTKQLPLIREMKCKTDVMICSVGTALRALISNGINPDYVMVSDPSDQIIKQFEGVNTEELKLFYLSTANYNAIKHFKGQRYIVYQEEYTDARNIANSYNGPTIQTGGSVATSLLEVIVKLGGKTIALVGQDLAYTNDKTHMELAPTVEQISNNFQYLEIDDYYLKERVKTSKNLSIYRKWFENYVKYKSSNYKFWNCTEGGAHIKGWNHQPLTKYYMLIKNNYIGDENVNR